MELRIALLDGSLRKESYSRKIASFLVETGKQCDLLIELAEWGELLLYNEDLEERKTPQAWKNFRKRIQPVDGVLFVTPEYNRSLPGGLKNALDVGSRPWGKSVWNGKPGGVISLSQGTIGGFGANHHLRQILSCLNVPVMAQPEAYLGNIASCFGEDGKDISTDTGKFLENFLQRYAIWAARNRR